MSEHIISSVQPLSPVRLFATPRTAIHHSTLVYFSINLNILYTLIPVVLFFWLCYL